MLTYCTAPSRFRLEPEMGKVSGLYRVAVLPVPASIHCVVAAVGVRLPSDHSCGHITTTRGSMNRPGYLTRLPYQYKLSCHPGPTNLNVCLRKIYVSLSCNHHTCFRVRCPLQPSVHDPTPSAPLPRNYTCCPPHPPKRVAPSPTQ